MGTSVDFQESETMLRLSDHADSRMGSRRIGEDLFKAFQGTACWLKRYPPS
jgi:hypothetical protein